jgi:hypothetical protein
MERGIEETGRLQEVLRRGVNVKKWNMEMETREVMSFFVFPQYVEVLAIFPLYGGSSCDTFTLLALGKGLSLFIPLFAAIMSLKLLCSLIDGE